MYPVNLQEFSDLTSISIVLLLGVYVFLRKLQQILFLFLQTFVVPGKRLTGFGLKEGAWAVVTGCTDGIGKEFALRLSEAGFNMILIARDINRLNLVSREIESKHSVKTQTHIMDFQHADSSKYNELTQKLNQHDIGVLVNNVGTSWRFAYFVETPLSKIDDMIQVNVNVATRIAHAILPGMINRKRSLILNIGSFSGTFPTPMLALYSATKAFLASFTSVLAEEVRQHNIMVEYLNTYYVVGFHLVLQD
ncbi:hypothetical protein NP233_g1775 [Leucocoprinus birnbaumii]|uniref:Uncharacterized protein n=1 Tax=Leucocoprinus birnbaumii TaxID=56174 RepID=A0AAD5VZD5_9AGAR|nr:hypothetical protein NP233_g1775 [Leucocoprinus birnbaumii]